ncbi:MULTISPECIES: hypothetical protein [Sporomusa]|uniref:hypothetical protein n=1 Tax=Sporomusa TaxID=2375 RepID=UPI00166DFCDF|nr:MULTISPECIES: hypothetical protein [Sporomusa]MCM0760091.1 hypothetical protein [Sporomusa sphaeroides DSM 2875]
MSTQDPARVAAIRRALNLCLCITATRASGILTDERTVPAVSFTLTGSITFSKTE